MASPNNTTVANGYPLGRPDDRDEDTLDLIVEEAIDKIPMATRLYPDVYSWSVVDAISQYLKDNGYQVIRR
jgi:hypothetical protein